MTPLGPHADFIVAAYAVATVVVVALIVWVWSDYNAQRGALGELEQHGVKRRSRRSGKK
jgi:heme exporter protein D